jgi:outer membrane protein
MQRACFEAPHICLRARTLALAMTFTLGAGPLHAQARWASTPPADPGTAGHRTYSLQQLIQVALANNPKYAEIQEEAAQAHLATTFVKSQYAPQLNLKALGGNEHTPLAITRNVSPRGYIVSSSREVIPSLQLKWLLFDFGRRKGQVDEATQNALAADAGLLGEQEKLVFDVSKAYFQATSAQGKVEAAKKALRAAQLVEEAIDDQRRHGRATVVEVAQAHRQTAAMKVALTKSSGDALTAFATLVMVVGLPSQSQFDLLQPRDLGIQDTPLRPLASLIQEAMQSRPDIRAAQDKVAAAEAKADAARAAYHPTISLQAQIFQNIGKTSSNGSPYSTINLTGNSLFVAFELPLFDGGARATNVSIAVSEKAQAQDALEDAKHRAAQQVVESYNDLKTSLDNHRQALDYTQAAQLAYEASLDSYRHGLASVTDLTNDEAALAQARANQEDADAEVLIAEAAVALAVGQQPTTN